MCGIAGILSEQSSPFTSHLQNMVQSLYHRGPDASGVHSFEKCSLGHARLSIIDLSGGKQPMLDTSSQVAITFNGEIYGYQDIKKKLTNYSFRTTSDTEVILALYETYGNTLLKHLPGAFAFGLWDNRSHSLLLARDRFGEKPLYYAFGKHNTFVFASEIKAILASGLIEPALNNQSVRHYLKHLYVHPHSCIYQNIHTLPPAHQLIHKDGKIAISKYWEIPTTNHSVSLPNATEEFQYLLEDSVKKQLVADVPVAAFLSGGLDSSTIVSIASRYNAQISTISFGFGDTINELPLAKKSAQQYNTNHIELQARDFKISDLLLEMQSVYDEPLADSSNIPTYIISKLARHYAKVVLTGDGADELLGGYSFWYQPLVYVEKLQHKPYLRHSLALFNSLLSSLSKRAANKVMRKLSTGLTFNSVMGAHAMQNIYLTDHEIDLLGIRNNSFPKKYDFPVSQTVNDAMNMDLLDYMPGDILVKTDRASMANSLELRAPFLDVKLAEFCISLPSRLKVNETTTKIILRKAFENQWIDELKTVPKQGFGAPVSHWLKEKDFLDLKQEYLWNKNKKIFGIMDYNSMLPYTKTDNYITWLLLVLSIWLETRQLTLK